MSEFKQYRRKQIAELRTYEEGETLTGVSISEEDAKAGSPKLGDMIARNPKNHADQWLVAAAYFADNFESMSTDCKACLGTGRVFAVSELFGTEGTRTCRACEGAGWL